MSGLLVIVDPLIQILIVALEIYKWVVIGSAILSWLIAFNIVNTYGPVTNVIGMTLYHLTEPVLRPIRCWLPNLGSVDISPVILILFILFVQMVLRRFQVFLAHGFY
jgi:YggT family protein